MHDPRLPPLVAPGPLRIPTKLDPVTRRRGQAPSGPQGLAAFLARPGLREALLATGSALLAQSDSPGTLGGALGRALPMGAQALQRGRQEAEIDALIEGAPPEMQQLLRALPASERVPALLGLQRGPDPVKLGANERLVDPESGAEVVGAVPEEKAPIRVQVGDETRFLDPDTREVLHVEGLSPEQIAARDAARNAEEGRERRGERFNQTNALADDFRAETATARETAEAVRRAQSAGDSAVGDQTRIIALNKLLDPGSIVRESEFERVGSSGGLSGRAQFYFNQMKSGRLPDPLRDEIEAEIAGQARAARDAFRPILDRFINRARSFDLDVGQITEDWFDGIDLGGEAAGAAHTTEGQRLRSLIGLGG